VQGEYGQLPAADIVLLKDLYILGHFRLVLEPVRHVVLRPRPHCAGTSSGTCIIAGALTRGRPPPHHIQSHPKNHSSGSLLAFTAVTMLNQYKKEPVRPIGVAPTTHHCCSSKLAATQRRTRNCRRQPKCQTSEMSCPFSAARARCRCASLETIGRWTRPA
jgi:hypothetical protein